MTNLLITKEEIRGVIRGHKPWAMECLYPENDYAWGTTKQNRANSVALMRSILKWIHLDAWPEESEDEDAYDKLIIRDGNWRLDLFISEGEKHANLSYAKDDHTAWVRRNERAIWVDFGIGGS